MIFTLLNITNNNAYVVSWFTNIQIQQRTKLYLTKIQRLVEAKKHFVITCKDYNVISFLF